MTKSENLKVMHILKDLLQLSFAMCLRKKIIFNGEQMHVRI